MNIVQQLQEKNPKEYDYKEVPLEDAIYTGIMSGYKLYYPEENIVISGFSRGIRGVANQTFSVENHRVTLL